MSQAGIAVEAGLPSRWRMWRHAAMRAWGPVTAWRLGRTKNKKKKKKKKKKRLH
jgi:hypothetical protein